MRATLNRVSLVTEIDVPHLPPDPRYFTHLHSFNTQISRVIFHEATHYWQQLSQTFMLMVAAEDWGRLQRFRDGGDAEAAGPLNSILRRPHPNFGYSANDLAESASRYWDILNVGPHNLVESDLATGVVMDDETRDLYDRASFAGLFRSSDDGFSQLTVEIAMRISGGSYALPYLNLLAKLGDRYDPQAMALFPLLAHWALQTPEPVIFYERFAELAGRKVARWSKWQHRLGRLMGRRVLFRDLEKMQDLYYLQLSPLMSKAVTKAGYKMYTGGEFLRYSTQRIHTIQAGSKSITVMNMPTYDSLAGHPVYAWASRWQEEFGRAAMREGRGDDLRNLFRNPDDSATLVADRLLALPGGPEGRALLIEYLQPPIHRFSDDRTWFTGVDPNNDNNLAIAQECMAIHNAWEEFRKVRRGY